MNAHGWMLLSLALAALAVVALPAAAHIYDQEHH